MPRISTIVTLGLGMAAGWVLRESRLPQATTRTQDPLQKRQRKVAFENVSEVMSEDVQLSANFGAPATTELRIDHLTRLWKAADSALADSYAIARRAKTNDADELLDRRRALADIMLGKALELSATAIAELDKRTDDLIKTTQEMKDATSRITNCSKVIGAVKRITDLVEAEG